jgi:hypothetical protein
MIQSLQTTKENTPWMDVRLKKESVEHLQNAIDNLPSEHVLSRALKQGDVFEREFPHLNANNYLAGNLSNSEYIKDKDNWFYKNVLEGLVEHMYYRDSWSNYYNIHIAKIQHAPTYELREIWVNFQKQHEFNPPHFHNGGLGFSFVVFMKIPTHWKEQHALPFSANSNEPHASNFQFLLGQGQGRMQEISIPLCPEDEGRMLFFPAWLHHQVFPFYECEEERITISGNIIPTYVKGTTTHPKHLPIKEKEKLLEKMKKELSEFTKTIKREKELKENG